MTTSVVLGPFIRPLAKGIASRDKCRTNIAGVHFDAKGVAVATDGHKVLALPHPAPSELQPIDETDGLFLPSAVIEAAFRAAKRGGTVSAEWDDEHRHKGVLVAVTTDGATSTIPFDHDAGSYPDWRMVLEVTDKRGVPGPVTINGAYLGAIADVFQAIAEAAKGDKAAGLFAIDTGDTLDPVFIRDGSTGDIVGAVMPCRAPFTDFLADWNRAAAAKEAKAA